MAFNPSGNKKDFQEMAKIATQEFWRYYQELLKGADPALTPDMNDITASVKGKAVVVTGKIPPSVAAKSPSLLEAGFTVGQRIVFDRLTQNRPDLKKITLDNDGLDFERFVDEVGKAAASLEPAAFRGDVSYTAWMSSEPDDFGNINVKNGFGIDSPCILESETESFLPFKEWSAIWVAREENSV